jgi:hypothetical protein
VDCKYHSLWGRWSSSEVNGLYGVGLKEKYQKRLQEILFRYTIFEVGDDSKIRF